MRLLSLILLFFSHFTFAQNISISNSHVIVNDTIYCLYEESANLPLTSSLSDSFNDYIIDAPDSEQFIKMNARSLSTGSGEINYYNIKMLSINKEINIKWRPQLFKQYIEDLVKYHVFYGKEVNESGSLALYYDWVKSPDILPYQTIQAGIIKSHHTGAASEEVYDASLKEVSFKDEKIYLDSTLIGTYQALPYNLRKHKPANNDKYYIIKDSTGNQVASLLVSQTSANIKLWIGENPEPLYFVTKETAEEKMLNVAIQVLLIKNILQ